MCFQRLKFLVTPAEDWGPQEEAPMKEMKEMKSKEKEAAASQLLNEDKVDV